MTEEVIISALKEAGCTVGGDETGKKSDITKLDLYMLGLSGGEQSKKKREELLRKFNLPSKLSANMMCEILSRITTLDEIKELIQKQTG